MVYLGVDWSVKEVVVCGLRAGATGIFRRSGIRPSLAAVVSLLEMVKKVLNDPQVMVIIEPGAPQWLNLFYAAGAEVRVVDSKQARRFAESLTSGGAKDDRRDAEMLARMGMSDIHRPRIWSPESEGRQKLDTVLRAHEQLTGQMTRFLRQFRADLRSEMPLVEPIFACLTKAWIHKLLRHAPTLWHLRQLSRSELDQILRGTRSHNKRRQALWMAIQESEAPWMSEDLAELRASVRRGQLDILETLLQQEAQLDELLNGCLSCATLAQKAQAIKGIGPLLAATVVVYGFDEQADEEDRDRASVRMGASPVFVGSGKTRAGQNKGYTRMRRAAPNQARRGVYLLGRMASLHTAWGRAMYVDARSRGQGAAAAYRRISRCLLRILDSLRRTGQDYDEGKYIASLKAKGVAWALGIQEDRASQTTRLSA